MSCRTRAICPDLQATGKWAAEITRAIDFDPMKANFVTHEAPGAIAINEIPAEPYELPPVGSTYWIGDGIPYTVERIEEEQAAEGEGASEAPPLIHLVRNRELQAAFYEDLPAGVTIDAGRRGDNGTWHVSVLARDGRLLGHAWNDNPRIDPNEVVARAKAEALGTLGASGAEDRQPTP